MKYRIELWFMKDGTITVPRIVGFTDDYSLREETLPNIARDKLADAWLSGNEANSVHVQLINIFTGMVKKTAELSWC